MATPTRLFGFNGRMYRGAEKVYDEYIAATTPHLSGRQRLYQEIIFGTLIYAVVVGFFDDYTNILSTTSYSITFFVAFALSLLTFVTVTLKKRVVKQLRAKATLTGKLGVAAFVWLALSLSKFVFMELLDLIFQTSLTINGFFGLTAVVITMTIAKMVFDLGFKKLADR